MHENISFGMELWRLLNAFHRRDFGQYFFQQAALVQRFKRPSGAAFAEHLGEFVAHSLARDLMNLWGQLLNRGQSGGDDLVFQKRRQEASAQDPEMVFSE